MRISRITGSFKTLILALALSQTCLLHAKPPHPKPAQGMPLKDLAQQAQYVMEASPLAPFAVVVNISFREPGVEIPPLERKAWRFKRGEVFKNVLGSEMPDTLLVFEAGTAAAVRAHRASHMSEDAPAGAVPAYASPIAEKLLGKEKSVFLFIDEVRDDSTITPSDRFELSASRAYEKGTSRKAIAALFPKQAPAE
jgi:hypothetical protein